MPRKFIVALSFFFIVLHSAFISAQDFKYIEIFYPKQNKVVKIVPLKPEIKSMVSGWVLNIQGI